MSTARAKLEPFPRLMVDLDVESVTLPPKRSPPYTVMLLSFFAVEALWACAYFTGAAESTTSSAIVHPARKGCPPNRETASMILRPSCGLATAEAHGASVSKSLKCSNLAISGGATLESCPPCGKGARASQTALQAMIGRYLASFTASTGE